VKSLRALILIALAATGLTCASVDGGVPPDGRAASAPPGSSWARIEPGMSDAQVRDVLGEPDDSNSYMTDKAWLLFYWGSDTHRAEWIYQGEGRVVFSMGPRSGALKVIRVLYGAETSD
jgi:hypothetical protein